jgi:hypothetical protein
LTIKQNYGRIGSSLWKPMTHLVRWFTYRHGDLP